MLAERIERVLIDVVGSARHEQGPALLAEAIHHSVFPGGARIRPQLALAVSVACGDADPDLSERFSAALELMHCASLVHDDLPCFDDAATRRGRPSVHAAFGERLAVLAGDSLIVLAFRCVIRSRVREALRLQQALSMLEFAVAPPFGIAAGQAWECEPRARLSEYQRSKTGALFAAATEGGAICGGGDGPAWRLLGESLGEAYQVADDIRDVVLDQRQLGKPANQDILLDRPSAARQFGLEGAYAYFDALMTRALSAIPPCAGEARLRNMVLAESERLLPLSVRSAGLQPAAGPLSIGLN